MHRRHRPLHRALPPAAVARDRPADVEQPLEAEDDGDERQVEREEDRTAHHRHLSAAVSEYIYIYIYQGPRPATNSGLFVEED